MTIIEDIPPQPTVVPDPNSSDALGTLLLTVPQVWCHQTRGTEITLLGKGEARLYHVVVPREDGGVEGEVEDACLLTVDGGDTVEAKQNILTLLLVAKSKAWQEGEMTFVVPLPDGETYRLEMSSASPAALELMCDILTHFAIFENRHHIRNTLALVDPESGELMELVAEDVLLKDIDEESVAARDDLAVGSSFLPAKIKEEGGKAPIVIDEEQVQLMREQRDRRQADRVRYMHTASEAIVTSSGWMADGLVKGATILAKGIQSGSKMIEQRIPATRTPVRLSDETKARLATAKRVSGTVYQTSTNVIDTAVNAAITTASKLLPHDITHPDTHSPTDASAVAQLGLATLYAAANIINGLGTTAAILGTSARDGMMGIIGRAYGEDARDAVGEVAGVGGNVVGVLVYFDGRGISRRVVLGKVGQVVVKRFAEQGEEGNETQAEMVKRKNEVAVADGKKEVVVETVIFDAEAGQELHPDAKSRL
ncbi:senescence-associated protein-domain-containing protein [Endogone sp. FLAS-F59071]|nr:senescence-associated protein-domain-containing protein [Endogone sp. FLAS-F59071]|eukprot:RUS17349.1 senescence-associated protein-domain-containing protein [Endogone sp. FLAS-F59071]